MHLEIGQLPYINRYIKNIGRSGNVRRSPTSSGYEKRGTEEVNQIALIKVCWVSTKKRRQAN